MALTTHCPHCQTAFRVANDQLKLRAGLVRCGACQKVFNGLENLAPNAAPMHAHSVTPPAMLLPAQEIVTAAEPEVLTPIAEEIPLPAEQKIVPSVAEEISPPFKQEILAPVAEHAFDAALETDAAEPSLPAPSLRKSRQLTETFEEDAWAPSVTSVTSTSETSPGEQPLPTPPEAAPAEPEAAPAQIPNSPASPPFPPIFIAPVMREDQASSADDHSAEAEEPGFVTRARRAQRTGGLLRTAMATGSAILLLTLLLQGAVIFRHQLAASFPRSAPILQGLCGTLGCRPGLPAQIESVSIESSELQRSATQTDTLTVAILLRNRSAVAQAWPNIELSLNDANDKILVRRVFVPVEYLSAAKDALAGIGATSEQSVRLLLDVGLLKPSGYRVYLFYP